MNHISIIYIIKQTNGSIRWLHSTSELILPGHHLATRIPEFQCLIRYVCFWFVLCQSALSSVFLSFFRECSHANVLFCVCFHAHTLHFTFTLGLLKFPKKHTKQWFKRPKPVYWLNVWQFEPIWARGVRLNVNYCSCLAQRDEMHWFLLMNQCCQNVM